jgi:hypothetical protein
LAVPDGTTAHVRCPSCKSVFPAAAGLAPAVPVLPAPPAPPPNIPASRAPVRNDFEGRSWRERRRNERDDRRRRERPSRDRDEEPAEDRRDGIADAPKAKQPRRRRDTAETTEEKRQKQAEFHRAMYGARLIQISLLFYIPAVLFVPLHQIVAQILKEEVAYILVIAGIMGMINFTLGLIGICLCVSGPPSPGHYRFGIAAIIASAVHAVLLFAVVAKTNANADYRGLERGTMMWAQLATQYESLSFYLAYVVYPDDIPLRRADTILSFLAGVAEMTRLILYMMTLGCLAYAGGDRELSERCTRMAGRVTIIPGLLAIAMLGYKIIVIETGAGQSGFVFYFLNYIYRAITLVVAAILGMTMRAVGDVVDVCEFPYQSHVDLGAVNESVSTFQ